MRSTESFDYIIVGGGSAGCVPADRLSHGGSARVLLLEAGGSDSDEAIRIPAALGMLFKSEVTGTTAPSLSRRRGARSTGRTRRRWVDRPPPTS
ncbi:Alcohol dehydrogenase [acceptor] [Streptomyces sp. MBT84]|nr:GMC family oxidoreductase N-terminal domain-containing protein [Streptomyces sp. MBT84]MBW8698621.1 Alcohol dehydrogenase [acceptor] [Streptomyces sp. MBT84]